MVDWHVTLNGQGHMLDLSRYRRRDHRPFALKDATGNREIGDLVAEDGIRTSDWSGGEGYIQYDVEAPERWRSGSGVDTYTEKGSVRIGPRMNTFWTFGGSITDLSDAVMYKGELCFGDSAGNLWRANVSGSLTSIGWIGAKPITALAVFFGKLYVANGTDGVVSSWDGTTFTATAFTVGGSPAGITAMATFYRQAVSYLYMTTKHAHPTMPKVYWWDTGAVSLAQYYFEEDQCRAAVVHGNRLYFITGDSQTQRMGIYSVDDSGSGGVYRSHVVMPDGYASSGASWNGKLWLGDALRGRVWSFDGSTLNLERQSSVHSGGPIRLAVYQDALWGFAKDGAGALGLLRYDGSGWSRPLAGITGTNARALAVNLGELWALCTATGPQVVRTNSTLQYVASGTLEGPLFDAGLPQIDKVARSVTILHSAIVSGQSVQIQYRTEDTGSWTTLGTSSTTNATSATFTFSGVSFKQIAFRVVLAGSLGATSTVVLYDVLFRYRPMPALRREWDLAVYCEGTADTPMITEDGAPSPQTGAQLSAALWTARGLGTPVTFVDLDGVSYSVWIDELEEEVEKISQRRGRSTVARVKLLEVA